MNKLHRLMIPVSHPPVSHAPVVHVPASRARPARAQRGFTLVEALVATLVLSIGLLGVAGLQLSALRNNNTAAARAQASYLAYDIVDRMRANRDPAMTGLAYNIALGAVATATGTPAERDLNAWKTMLAAVLPSGDGAIVVNNTGGVGEAMITIQWEEAGNLISFVTSTRI